jgi:hypothetical protein
LKVLPVNIENQNLPYDKYSMKFYKELLIDHLPAIQEEILGRIPKNLLTHSNLTYLDNSRKLFRDIEPLKEYFISNGIYQHIGPVGIYVNPAKFNGNLHVDNGTLRHSLNIPIAGCDNTWINFYETNVEPTVVKRTVDGKELDFLRYNESDCSLIYRTETNKPYILDTRTPHKVENSTSNTRVMLLFRLYDSYSPDFFTS